jgi:hypothetical protein
MTFCGSISRRLPWEWAVLLAGLACSACATKGEKLHPVHGQVFYEGQPIPEALIIFHPLNHADANAVKPRALAGPDGSFKVYTYVADDGAPAGDYTVTVAWKKKKERRKAPTEKRTGKEVEVSLPKRYQHPETSGLRVQVQEGVNELPPFFLTR